MFQRLSKKNYLNRGSDMVKILMTDMTELPASLKV